MYGIDQEYVEYGYKTPEGWPISDTQHCTNEDCYTFSHTVQYCGKSQPRRCGCHWDYTDEERAIEKPSEEPEVIGYALASPCFGRGWEIDEQSYSANKNYVKGLLAGIQSLGDTTSRIVKITLEEN